ncbi:hypothetical protein AA0535_1696 [Asaia krungthepensis NRIC 0535]|uniref:Uncharacterized protein n=1 Tax=Asaia krungthepensis NRIC 0535 TaxID=1307925 RepID=A0ABQ0Q355_9PROT|nr:hypothetical protein AA0535_1696 [Asaia krungthepensis NRIC 0535]
MLDFLFPRLRRLKAENEWLRQERTEAMAKLWDAAANSRAAQRGSARTLALLAAKDKEIDELRKTVRTLWRERDRAGRFTHEAP